MDTFITCSVCGFRFDPSRHAGCASCPMHEGCTTACCPNCGTTNINPQASGLARWIEKIIKRAGNARIDLPADLTLDRVPSGALARVLGFAALGPDQDRHLQAYGLLPGRQVRVLARRPLVIVQVEQTELALEIDVAQAVFVRLETPLSSN